MHSQIQKAFSDSIPWCFGPKHACVDKRTLGEGLLILCQELESLSLLGVSDLRELRRMIFNLTAEDWAGGAWKQEFSPVN